MKRTRVALLTAPPSAQSSESRHSRVRVARHKRQGGSPSSPRKKTGQRLPKICVCSSSPPGPAARQSASAAVRALGRLERRDVIIYLLPLVRAGERPVREEAANALAQAFKGEPLADSSTADQVQIALETLSSAPRTDAVYRALGRLPYETVAQARAAEEVLRAALELSDPPAAAARGAESLARLHRKLSPLSEETVDRLRLLASRRSERTVAPAVRRNAMAAVVAAQGADARDPASCAVGRGVRSEAAGGACRRRRWTVPYRRRAPRVPQHLTAGSLGSRARRSGALVGAPCRTRSWLCTAPECVERSRAPRRARRARRARRPVQGGRERYRSADVGVSHAARYRPLAARGSCVRRTGQALSRAGEDRHGVLCPA